MSYIVEQRDINTVKGFINLALNDLEYSRYRSSPEDKKREAFWRAHRTLTELVGKIEKFEVEKGYGMVTYIYPECPKCGSRNHTVSISQPERVYEYPGALTYTLKGKWMEDEDCVCNDCGFKATAKDFDPRNKKED